MYINKYIYMQVYTVSKFFFYDGAVLRVRLSLFCSATALKLCYSTFCRCY